MARLHRSRTPIPLPSPTSSVRPARTTALTAFTALTALIAALAVLAVLAVAVSCAAPPFFRPAPLSDDRAAATRLLAEVRVVRERVTVLGYDRSRFGGWANAGGRTTRDLVLAEWTGPDPYTGDPLPPDAVDVDHVYPLAAAWDFGAHAWSPAERRAFANDAARNLLPTASAVNREKSDATPAEWLPAPSDLRCPYSVRYLDVAVAWDLPVSVADWEAMAAACGLGP